MLKARKPGLWMADGDDEKQVLDAMKHLLALLDDPFYFEAHKRLLREKHPKLFGLKGRLPTEVGALARGIQEDLIDELDTKPRKGPGRPKDALTPIIERLRVVLDNNPGSLKQECRAAVRVALGFDSESETEWLYKKVRINKRNAKKAPGSRGIRKARGTLP
jgi:hypothetical protein